MGVEVVCYFLVLLVCFILFFTFVKFSQTNWDAGVYEMISPSKLLNTSGNSSSISYYGLEFNIW